MITVEHLRKTFPIKKGIFKKTAFTIDAVSDVSFEIKTEKTLGLVGESGCGKTTLGRCLLRLIEPSSGSICFDGKNILELDAESLRTWRKNAQMIFQDPMSSLNPRVKVRQMLLEGAHIHALSEKMNQSFIEELLHSVGLDASSLEKYPHEFSGGQRQRLGIARALSVDPKWIVADEPVSALDVSVQAQIVNLLLELQEKKKLTYVFISHDLNLVEFISDEVLVMYLGEVVEKLPAKTLKKSALHPYTQALIASIPGQGKQKTNVRGEVTFEKHSGCVFASRCSKAEKKCENEKPFLSEKQKGHWVSCHLI